MKHSFRIVILLVVLFSFLESKTTDRIAVATKVQGEVEYERGNDGFKKLSSGNILQGGDRVRTGKNGFTAIIFIDDKSMLKIKGKTEVVINGQRSQGSISKKIRLDGGTLRAQITKQRRGDFVVQTPVSVASVKGTDFWLLSNDQTGDQLIGIDGLISFMNLISGDSIDVSGGFTGLSSLDGSIQTFTTDPTTIPTDPMGEESEQPSRLEIEFKGPDGKTKTLIIDYK